MECALLPIDICVLLVNYEILGKICEITPKNAFFMLMSSPERGNILQNRFYVNFSS